VKPTAGQTKYKTRVDEKSQGKVTSLQRDRLQKIESLTTS
jgi:hypothetical protein